MSQPSIALNQPIGQALQIVLLGVAVFVCIAVYLIQSLTSASQNTAPLMVLVLLAGAVGGIANNFRRLQKLTTDEWEKSDPTSRWLMTLQIYVSPLIGSLFAFVLTFAFIADIAQGAMFPTFEATDKYGGFREFAAKTLPAKNVDVAKALFWAFVAGFAEQFVPNFIDKVAKEEQESAADNENKGKKP